MAILLALAALSPVYNCTATDGDTLNCNGERIRLIGMDAPEMGRCPSNRRCVKGDGQAAKRYLATLIRGRSLTIERIGRDRYDRTLALVYVDGLNLSCAMIAAGQAAYRADWDNGGRVAKDC